MLKCNKHVIFKFKYLRNTFFGANCQGKPENPQGNVKFLWWARETAKKMSDFIGGLVKQSRKYKNFLEVLATRQGIYISLMVYYHSQENSIFLDGLIWPLKEICGRQENLFCGSLLPCERTIA
jgi:hypothetical protein